MVLRHIFRSEAGNEFGAMLRGKRSHKQEFAHDLFRIHFLVIYTDMIEYNIDGDMEASLIRSLPFVSKLKAGEIITTGQYINYQTFSNLQFRALLKYFFHCFHIDFRDISGKKNNSVSFSVSKYVQYSF